MLLHIIFLHQTATVGNGTVYPGRCYISSFYIKPQPRQLLSFQRPSCYISSFYIKPQRYRSSCAPLAVATYLLSTSNRNFPKLLKSIRMLLYIFFLHQTATLRDNLCCCLPLLYIFFLHQTATLVSAARRKGQVAIYLLSTSNRNYVFI